MPIVKAKDVKIAQGVRATSKHLAVAELKPGEAYVSDGCIQSTLSKAQSLGFGLNLKSRRTADGKYVIIAE